MVCRLAAFGAVALAAAATLASTAPGAGGDVRVDVISVNPRPPKAGRPFELVARVEFAPTPGSLRSVVWIGARRFRNMRLVWKDSIARCSFVVPDGARGKRLLIGLTAMQGDSRTRTSFTFTVAS
jgi:hypothetical protein